MLNNKSTKNELVRIYEWRFFNPLFILFFVFCLSSSEMYSQYSKYWIQFTDKNNSPYTTTNPSAYLSARSLQRRLNQSIAIQQNDLPVNPAYANSVASVPNVTIINRSKWFNAVTIMTTDTNALNTIAAFSFVSNVKPVQRYHRKFGIEEQKGPSLSTQRGATPKTLSYSYGPSFTQINMIGGVCLHNQGFNGSGMQIAILDAGFFNADTLPVFDSLRANNQILGTWNFVDNNSLVYTSHVHGTMVLSTMGGNMPDSIVGTAPKAKFWLFVTEAGATEYVIEEDNWISGAEYADSVGADVLTTSLGYTEFDSVIIGGVTVVNPDNHTYADMDGNTCHISIGTDIAVSKGMFAVCSAGNSGGSSWNFIGAPADADSVLAIGAVDSLGNYAWFSSNGPSFDGRVKPNVAAQGQDCVIEDPATTGITRGSGTSFAGPITAELVACLWQAHPGATNMQLFNAIQQTSSQYNNPDTLIGYGRSDFCAANLALGIEENNSSEDLFSVYPNPFSDAFTVHNLSTTSCELKMFDVLGRSVFEQAISKSNTVINTRSLAKGPYVLNLVSEQGTYSRKIVKY